MSIDELNELTEKGYITKVGEYEAAKAAASSYTVESAANKKDFVDATSYAEVKAQIDTDFDVEIAMDVDASIAEGCSVNPNVGHYTRDKGSFALKATAGSLAKFDGWYLNDTAGAVSLKASYTPTITANCKYTAKFVAKA